MHVICAKAVAFGEVSKPNFVDYIKNVILNAQVLSKVMIERGLEVVSGGTDTHLTLVDLRPKNLTGKDAERSLENAELHVIKTVFLLILKAHLLPQVLDLVLQLVPVEDLAKMSLN